MEIQTVTHGTISLSKEQITSPPSARFYGEIGGSRCSASTSEGSHAMSVAEIGQVGLSAQEAVRVADWLAEQS